MSKELTTVEQREDGIYEVTIKRLFNTEEMVDKFKNGDYARSYGESAQFLLARDFVALFIKNNYDELCKLIDMDAVKLMAMRRVMGFVASADKEN